MGFCNDSRHGEVRQEGFPRAEWLPAKEVLMHTPGEEIFDGVIHSAAGLFERYFDIDKAAAEHVHYMEDGSLQAGDPHDIEPCRPHPLYPFQA